MKNILYSYFFLFLFTTCGLAQNAVFKNSSHELKHLFDDLDQFKLYGVEIDYFEPLPGNFYDPWQEALSSAQMQEGRSIDLLKEQYIFILDKEIKSQTSAQIALSYFNTNQLDQLIAWSEMTNSTHLEQGLKDELTFKTGYAHLVRKEFSKAKRYFDKRNYSYNIDNDYYLAMCNYYLGDLKSAILGFEKIDSYDPYDQYIPYYLTQIYFADKDFAKTVSYGSEALKKPDLQNKARMQKIIGLAHFELGNFNEAETYLEEYARTAEKLTKEEFYHIAYAQYQSGKYNESIDNFKELSNLKDELGTMANYFIAEIYLRKNDAKAAQTAFYKLSKNAVVKGIREDAQFNYALLSYELGEERNAINTIKNISSEHPHFEDAQKLLVEILKNTNDYLAAIDLIEKMSSKSIDLETIYQKLAYKQAVLDYNDGRTLDALRHFSIAANNPVDSDLVAKALFWQANLHYEQEKKTLASNLLEELLDVIKENKNLETSESYSRAHYLQGYILWDKEQYASSQPHFQESLKSERFLSKLQTADAHTRIADVYLLKNNYNKSNENYLQALRNNVDNDYAAYQLGIVAGLQKEPIDRILILEEFLEKYPNSEYRDNALFDIADTYLAINKLNNAILALNDFDKEFSTNSPFAEKALLRRGLISYNLGNVDEAIKAYTKVFELNPTGEEKKEALLALEELYVNELNDPNSYFEIAEGLGGIKLNEFDKDSISFHLAYELFREGEYFNAISNFDKYIKNYKTGFYVMPAHYYSAEAYSLQKDYGKAVQSYEWIVNKGESEYYLKALKKAALINYNHAQDYSKAFGYYSKLIEKENIVDLEYISAALICANLISNEDAVIKYANMLVQQADATSDQKATAYFYLAKASYNRNSLDEAIMAYNKVVMLARNNKAAEASYALAKIFFERGNLEQAETQALETTERGSNYPFWVAKSLLLLTDIYIERVDLYNGRAAAEAIIENYSESPDIIAEAQSKLNKIEELERSRNRIMEVPPSDQIQLDTLKRN